MTQPVWLGYSLNGCNRIGRPPLRAPVPTFRRARKLRREMTLPEVVLWEHLRRGGTERMRFRRQHSLGPYVLDFYCAQALLCVEVDGAAHDLAEVAHRDANRDAWLGARGVRILRFAASDILDDAALEGVLRAIAAAGKPASG